MLFLIPGSSTCIQDAPNYPYDLQSVRESLILLTLKDAIFPVEKSSFRARDKNRPFCAGKLSNTEYDCLPSSEYVSPFPAIRPRSVC
jgi:hypothetical protein